ncbi:hypothetical protein BC2230_40434 [Burkholderia cepacia]
MRDTFASFFKAGNALNECGQGSANLTDPRSELRKRVSYFAPQLIYFVVRHIRPFLFILG